MKQMFIFLVIWIVMVLLYPPVVLPQSVLTIVEPGGATPSTILVKPIGPNPLPPMGTQGLVFYWDASASVMVPVSESNPLPASVNIASVTVVAFPVYMDALGNPATALLDTLSQVIISEDGGIASVVAALSALSATSSIDLASLSLDVHDVETALSLDIQNVEAAVASAESTLSTDIQAVKAAIDPPTTIQQQTITLTPGVVSTFAFAGRRSVALKAHSTNAETVWLSYDNAATAAAVLSGDELTPGARVSLLLPDGFIVGAIASTAETIYVCEQGD